MIRFHPDEHHYESIDPAHDFRWMSASRFPEYFSEPFDPLETSIKSSKNKKSKWYGIPSEEIRDIWIQENKRSTNLGTWYHNQEEQTLLSASTFLFQGREIPIIKPIWENGFKIARDQKLQEGLYPEHMTYLYSKRICGQFDKPIVFGNKLHIRDYKTNKNLKEPAYVNWEGRTKRLLAPLYHVESTHLMKYGLQLSLGMYMILRHNPQLQAGDIIIEYVTFEREGEDKYGYPITRLDENQEPIIKDIEEIKLDYMKREVELGLDHLMQTYDVQHT